MRTYIIKYFELAIGEVSEVIVVASNPAEAITKLYDVLTADYGEIELKWLECRVFNGLTIR